MDNNKDCRVGQLTTLSPTLNNMNTNTNTQAKRINSRIHWGGILANSGLLCCRDSEYLNPLLKYQFWRRSPRNKPWRRRWKKPQRRWKRSRWSPRQRVSSPEKIMMVYYEDYERAIRIAWFMIIKDVWAIRPKNYWLKSTTCRWKLTWATFSFGSRSSSRLSRHWMITNMSSTPGWHLCYVESSK